MHLMAQDLSLVTCHPCSCAFLLESLLLFYFDLSFPVFFFHLLRCELHTELDNLIAMQDLRYSANKGSDDAYDVSVSLTFLLDASLEKLVGSRHLGADPSPEVPLGSSSGDSVGEWWYVTFLGSSRLPRKLRLAL